jgi:hypothetical protein
MGSAGDCRLPSLIIWGVLLYLVRANSSAEEWPLYLIFVALPLPLIFPIYKRYLRGPLAKAEKTELFLLRLRLWLCWDQPTSFPSSSDRETGMICSVNW